METICLFMRDRAPELLESFTLGIPELPNEPNYGPSP